MSTNRTPNYNLNQWEKSDKVLMEDFNADNAKIDAALKAEADVRAAAVTELSGLIAGHTSTLANKGNCQLYWSRYVGDGAASRTFHFSMTPALVMILGDSVACLGIRDEARGILYRLREAYFPPTSWSGKSITLTDPHDDDAHRDYICNQNGKTYHLVAFLEAGR